MQMRINNKGFSLVELAYVLVLLGLLTALSAPSFFSYLRNSRVAGSQNELIADLHFARTLAVKNRLTHHVEFDNDEYRIVETATATIIRTRVLPNGVTCSSTADPNFYPWGLADPVTISFSGGSSVKTLTLAANGNVSH